MDVWTELDDDPTFGVPVVVEPPERSPLVIAIAVAAVVVLVAVVVAIGTLLWSLFIGSASASLECTQLGDGTHRVRDTIYVCSPLGSSSHPTR